MDQEAVDLFRSCIPLFHSLGDPARQDIILMPAKKKRLSVNEIAERSHRSAGLHRNGTE